MTLVRLDGGKLFVHSPIAPDSELVKAVTALGEVAFLVSPNKIHHLYLGQWGELFPRARIYASPGLKEKRRDISFDGKLGNVPEPGWAGQIDQVVFAGSPVMQEVVFFHEKSRTVIFADLIENFDRDWFTGWKGWIARHWGITQPDGRAPLEWRLSFLFGHKQAKKALAKIMSWQPERIIVAHGACYEKDGVKELKRAFRWV
ncbi:MAG TPA: DUF4336 domain-containing protein [Rhizobiales bacterium]|nr:DUF4336 domain-containing protein [Hyphomicrobiales bacterium]